MTRLPVLGSIAALLAIATACSYHWSATASTGELALALSDEPVVYEVELTLSSDEGEAMPCEALTWSLRLEFSDLSDGVVIHELGTMGDDSGWGGEIDLSEERTAFVASGVSFERVSRDACRADADLILQAEHTARGDFTVHAEAMDTSSGREDDPVGRTSFEVRVAEQR